MSSDAEKAPGTSGDGGDDSSRLAAFEQHRGLLFSIAYRMLGSVADAEDTLQDAFIRWQRASDLDIRSPKAFLVTIAKRRSRRQARAFRIENSSADVIIASALWACRPRQADSYMFCGGSKNRCTVTADSKAAGGSNRSLRTIDFLRSGC